MKLVMQISVFLLTICASTPSIYADVIIKSPSGKLFVFEDDCCDDWDNMPDDWSCYDDCGKG